MGPQLTPGPVAVGSDVTQSAEAAASRQWICPACALHLRMSGRTGYPGCARWLEHDDQATRRERAHRSLVNALWPARPRAGRRTLPGTVGGVLAQGEGTASRPGARRSAAWFFLIKGTPESSDERQAEYPARRR
jgi:hypothetical protein